MPTPLEVTRYLASDGEHRVLIQHDTQTCQYVILDEAPGTPTTTIVDTLDHEADDGPQALALALDYADRATLTTARGQDADGRR